MLTELIPQQKTPLAYWIKKEVQKSVAYRRPTSSTEIRTG
jgi:hypothetical protein